MIQDIKPSGFSDRLLGFIHVLSNFKKRVYKVVEITNTMH
jgi:hypothetical protein